MASRIGETAKAYRYFMDTALMDLTDLQKRRRWHPWGKYGRQLAKFDLWFCWSLL